MNAFFLIVVTRMQLVPTARAHTNVHADLVTPAMDKTVLGIEVYLSLGFFSDCIILLIVKHLFIRS